MTSSFSRVAITKELAGDLDTPVSVYLKLSQHMDAHGSFLLESVTGGDKIARYSFLGFNPFCEFKANGHDIVIRHNHHLQTSSGNPIDALQAVLSQQVLLLDNLDIPALVGGAIGYFSWESIAHIEPIVFRHSIPPIHTPLAHFVFPSLMVIFDHAKRKMILIALCKPGNESDGTLLLQSIEKILQTPLATGSLIPVPGPAPDTLFDHVLSNFSKDHFMDTVKRAKNHVFEGDIFQLLLSQKFQIPQSKSPLDIYRALRLINPSPYMFFMNFGSYQLAGSSPEILVKLENKKATVRPIAGTRPRILGQEKALSEELLKDEKERSEHIMLVDLGRNDLGRVCQSGSITVEKLMEVETYSHVLHIASHITGILDNQKTAFDLFKATFPAGTLSGTPKIKAIKLIDQLEPDPRGNYAGALGYFDLHGNMDLCIMIRTALIQNGMCTVQAGAGIVADSDPETEFYESRNKAKGILHACMCE